MRRLQAPDVPVDVPARDLLGMHPHAERLAEFLEDVELPFTLGVYGEWGQGKTSFTKLLVHYLKKRPQWEQMRFVSFSAWPYVTSDAIWRALLLGIAENLYLGDGEVNNRTTAVATASVGKSVVRQFLASDVAPAKAPPSEADLALERYRELRRRVDKSVTAIANRTAATRIDETAQVAVATAFLEVASQFTPWLGGLRKLFGLYKSIDLAAADRGSAAPPDPVSSVEEIRREIARMFEHRKTGRLVVLVDDLDRCLPEIALDVLEMIKIFFAASKRCFFIVAADRELIGRGLRVRLRESVRGESPDEIRRLLRTKGDEYFEKIIQFGVHVPEQSWEDSHRLLSSHFPGWACATDILCTAVGSNPRRLKQQCNLMAYKHVAADRQERA